MKYKVQRTSKIHFYSMWGFAREYVWQNLWDKLLDTIGEDPFNIMYYGTFGLTTIVFWTVTDSR